MGSVGDVARLVALLIPAVQSVRQKAAQTECANHQRQVILGIHHYAAAHGQLPQIDTSELKLSMFVVIHGFVYDGPMVTHGSQLRNGAYVCPSDPSSSAFPQQKLAHASYAANAQVFYGAGTLNQKTRDGASHTIAVAEHYYICDGNAKNEFLYPLNGFPFSYISHPHPATFADGGARVPHPDRADVDNHPVPGPDGTTRGSLPGTFQHMPREKECDFRYAQTAHPSGMVTAMADGSVRILSANITAATFWALVSPDSQDFPGGDW